MLLPPCIGPTSIRTYFIELELENVQLISGLKNQNRPRYKGGNLNVLVYPIKLVRPLVSMCA